ncbi:MAG: PEP-CTERM sorting domain-containing protein [Chthonomonas sp.]|nr:PEP-CTERM sorting domain-containing protein [Chthonomonas sp.]
MNKAILCLTASLLTLNGLAQVPTFRHYFAYGDDRLVQLARQSGADTTAAIGKEIPQGVQLRVPTNTDEFRVQYRMTYVSGAYETIFSRFHATNFVFDRAWITDGSVLDLSSALGAESYRKLAPSHVQVDGAPSNFINGQPLGGWINPTTFFDNDSDGMPDTFTYKAISGGFAGAWNGSSDYMLRDIGLHGGIGGYREGSGTGGSLYSVGESRYICDVSWRANLAVGEQYGLLGSETGLGIHVRPGRVSPTWGGTHFFQSLQYYGNEPDWINIGARYNLIGAALVPEPTSMAALGVALLLLTRRQRQSRPRN